MIQPRITEDIAEGIIDCYETMLTEAAQAGVLPLASRTEWARQVAIVLQVSPFGMRDETPPSSQTSRNVDWREVLLPVIESMECRYPSVSDGHSEHCIINQSGLLENLVDAIETQLD